MPNTSLENQEIIRLLAKLKEETPDYPADLVKARKYSFMKQIIDMKISLEGHAGDGKQQGGKGGPKGRNGGSREPRGSGAALSGGSTFLGISLKTVFAFGAVVVMLTAAYLFREQIVEYLAENEIISTEETGASPFASTPVGLAQETPTAVTAPTFGATGLESVATAPGSGSGSVATAPGLVTGPAATQAVQGSNNNNQAATPGSGISIIPRRSTATPDQGLARNTGTPTPTGQGGLAGYLQYLFCVLQGGGESCR